MSAKNSTENAFDPELMKDLIAGRLADIVRQGGGPASVASRAGMPLRTLKSYIRAESEPRLSAALQIVDGAGATREGFFEDLLRGMGLNGFFPSNEHGEPSSQTSHAGVTPAATLNVSLLAEVIGVLEQWLDETGGEMPPSSKAAAIQKIYEYVLDDAGENPGVVTPRDIRKLLRLVI